MALHATAFRYGEILKETIHPGISIHDITHDVREAIGKASIIEGAVTVLSRHTTTAVVINEAEVRLMDDIRQWLHKMADPASPYLHNDLSRREAPADWPGGHSAWVKQEPINAHSHLLSIMLGNTLHIPVSKGKLCLGTWQSILLVELDGPRKRSVGIQVVGETTSAPDTTTLIAEQDAPRSIPDDLGNAEQKKFNSLNPAVGIENDQHVKSIVIKDGASLKSLADLDLCDALETLEIHNAHEIIDLRPLSACRRLKKLILRSSKVTDLSPLSSLTMLEVLDLGMLYKRLWVTVKDLSPLSQCKKLKKLNLVSNDDIEDLSPLCQLPDLEELNISSLRKINDLDFLQNGFSKLRILKIVNLEVDDLSPLVALPNLEELDCEGIPGWETEESHYTSLNPLARCRKLKKLYCSNDQLSLNKLKRKRPDLDVEEY